MNFKAKYICPSCNKENEYNGKVVSLNTKIIHKCVFCSEVLYLIGKLEFSVMEVEAVRDKDKIEEYEFIIKDKKGDD